MNSLDRIPPPSYWNKADLTLLEETIKRVIVLKLGTNSNFRYVISSQKVLAVRLIREDLEPDKFSKLVIALFVLLKRLFKDSHYGPIIVQDHISMTDSLFDLFGEIKIYDDCLVIKNTTFFGSVYLLQRFLFSLPEGHNSKDAPELIFKMDFIFEDNTVYGPLTIFGRLIPDTCTINYSISYNDFKETSRVNLYNSKFTGKVIFHENKFHWFKAFNTKFLGLVDFYKSEFNLVQQFSKTDFMDQFLHCKVDSNSYISFEESEIQKGIDISKANFNCNLQFWGLKLSRYDDPSLFGTDDNDYNHSTKLSLDEILKCSNRFRESIRIIKNDLKVKGNFIESMRYHVMKMKEYKYYLYLKILFIKNYIEKNISFNKTNNDLSLDRAIVALYI